MTRGRSRRAGMTLVEVLLALALVGLALLAWAGLQARVVRVERANQVRRELAAWMRSELRLQRNVRASECRSRAAPAGWRCRVVRTCVDGVDSCETEAVQVTIAPPGGAVWTGATAVWWPLQRAPVESAP